ncbi:MAG: glycosyltransferase family 2 protein [Alphaproteobacteria bacterium]|nr:MAG: glycosyltransferase family 2 protein [Alphaproteobacteria bacterium]
MTKLAAKPWVGIGIMTYGRPVGLARMIDCLKAQTYQNLVVFICDNASPDAETQAIGKAAEKSDSRFRYVRHATNLGMSGNFKAAYELGCGAGVEYFLWASDDDWFAPEYVEHCLELLDKNPLAQAAIPTPYMGNNDGVNVLNYPGFARFTNVGLRGWRRRWYLWRYLGEPIVKAKGTLPYLLFRRASMEHMMARYTPRQLNIWGGDIALLYGYLKDFDVVGSDRVLMEKNYPTKRTWMWFPIAWSYQPLPRHIKELKDALLVVADTPAERMQVRLYVAGLWIFWGTVGYPAKAFSLMLRVVADKLKAR